MTPAAEKPGASPMSDTGLACLASPDVLARARNIKLFLLTDGDVCRTAGARIDTFFEKS
jgi:hypothetical protein